MKRLALIVLFALATACGDEIEKQPPETDSGGNNAITDAGGMDGSMNNVDTDAGMPDSGTDMGPAETCDDGVLNQDESDVDCGGTCDACPNGATCNDGDDCTSAYCDESGACADEPLGVGETCMTPDECASGECETFGDDTICTESCTDTCAGQNLACFGGQCVPDTFCDDPDGDGLGFGPGCSGQPCDRCADDATCSEQGDGSFVCMCNSGFNGDGETCTDIDECAAGNPCDPNATCTNTPGSFTCECDSGFSGDGTVCADIDECADGTDTCDVNATCSNLAGTFDCTCESGFNGDGFSCTDIDECATGANNCNTNATCTNIPGAFTCACAPGFTGNGFSCVDIDECANGSANCDTNAVCTNTPGSFSCACPNGFTGDGTTCTDVNECATGGDDCDTNASCSNTIGGFTCTCDPGYTGDGVTCSVSNPCTDGTANCGSNTRCVDLSGGNFTCICDSGYDGDPFAGCTNIDECSNGTAACDINAQCFDTPGNYVCSCDTGYTGNGFTCADVNECATNTDNCDTNATCTNTDGGFTCACDPGYLGDGVTCAAQGDTCGQANVIGSLPFSASGDTSGPAVQDDYAYGDNQCPGDSTGNGNGQGDLVYQFTPTTTASYIIDTAATFDERIYLVTDCSSIGTSCLEAAFLPPLAVTLTAGTTYFIIIDGGFSGDEGTFDIDMYDDVCTNNNPCDPVATCDNTPAGAQCTCPSGYTGDGFTCTSTTPRPSAGDLVISEIMQNPSAQFDSDGEWFELYNASGQTLDLNDCRVVSGSSVGADEFTITGLPSVPAGGYVSFARSAALGVTADYVYNGAINLNNTSDDLQVFCTPSTSEILIDEVAWDDGATFPDPDGASMNLDPGSRNTTANDLGTNWCEATSAYFSTDLGTPGAANTNCP